MLEALKPLLGSTSLLLSITQVFHSSETASRCTRQRKSYNSSLTTKYKIVLDSDVRCWLCKKLKVWRDQRKMKMKKKKQFTKSSQKNVWMFLNLKQKKRWAHKTFIWALIQLAFSKYPFETNASFKADQAKGRTVGFMVLVCLVRNKLLKRCCSFLRSNIPGQSTRVCYKAIYNQRPYTQL